LGPAGCGEKDIKEKNEVGQRAAVGLHGKKKNRKEKRRGWAVLALNNWPKRVFAGLKLFSFSNLLF
jgi:hypothetical protein